MRKHFSWLFVLGLVLALAGCSQQAAASTPSGTGHSTTVLTQAGTVSKAKLTALSQANRTFSFTGKTTNGITYTWRYTAAQVKNPAQQKLALQLTTKNQAKAQKQVTAATEVLGFRLAKFHLAGAPTLTITIPTRWNATRAVLLTGTHPRLSKTQPVSLKRTQHRTQLTFTVTAVNQPVYLVGVKPAAAKNAASTTQAATAAQQAKSAESKAASSRSTTQASASGTTSTSAASSTTSSAAKSASTARTTADSTASASSRTTSTTPATAAKPTVTISISAATAASHLAQIKASKRPYVPASGWILAPTKVTLTSSTETVYDILKQATAAHGIQLESRWTPVYNAYYVSGIHNLYEFDGGAASGWMYAVDGWFPNYGSSAYNTVKSGSVIKWVYTLELGADVGAGSW